MSREAFEKSLRAGYLPSKFKLNSDGTYRLAYMERDWQAWKRAEQHFEQEFLMLKALVMTLETDLSQIASIAHDEDGDSHEKRSARLGVCAQIASRRKVQQLRDALKEGEQ